eukprot:scaffold114214_cov30-Tisochrysis_lutea.AAC.9
MAVGLVRSSASEGGRTSSSAEPTVSDELLGRTARSAHSSSAFGFSFSGRRGALASTRAKPSAAPMRKHEDAAMGRPRTPYECHSTATSAAAGVGLDSHASCRQTSSVEEPRTGTTTCCSESSRSTNCILVWTTVFGRSPRAEGTAWKVTMCGPLGIEPERILTTANSAHSGAERKRREGEPGGRST